MAGPHAHTLIRDCCNKFYVHSGSGDRGQSSVCREKTYQQHITAMSWCWHKGSQITAPPVDISTHAPCKLTIYPVCFAWIHSSRHRRQSWPCQPSPGRSPLWTPHRSGQTSTRCHRTGRCWENPAGQTDRYAQLENLPEIKYMQSLFINLLLLKRQTSDWLLSEHTQHQDREGDVNKRKKFGQ